jgi:hypothetical protein
MLIGCNKIKHLRKKCLYLNIVTCKNDHRQSLDWWLSLLDSYSSLQVKISVHGFTVWNSLFNLLCLYQSSANGFQLLMFLQITKMSLYLGHGKFSANSHTTPTFSKTLIREWISPEQLRIKLISLMPKAK